MKKHTIWKCQHPHNWDPIHLLSTTQGKLIWLMWRSGGMGERLTFIHYTHRPSNRRFVLDLCLLPLFSFGRILWIYSHILHARGPVRKEKGGHCLQLYPLPCEPRLYGTFRKCCRNSIIANLLIVHEEMCAILFHLKLLRICVSLFNTVIFHHFICTLHCSVIQLMLAVKEGMRSFMWADWKSSKETE